MELTTKKIAVPINEKNQIDDHFGHCDYYGVYTISSKNEIVNVETIKSEQGCGCKSNIAVTLSKSGVTTMLAGGIGGGAINVLNSCGIQVIKGCSGDAQQAIKGYLKGEVVDSGSSCEQHENHHGGGDGHVCNH